MTTVPAMRKQLRAAIKAKHDQERAVRRERQELERALKALEAIGAPTSNGAGRPRSKQIPLAERCRRVEKVLRANPSTWYNVTELARRADVPPGTLLRDVDALRERRIAITNGSEGRARRLRHDQASIRPGEGVQP